MKRILLSLICLVGASVAAEPTYYALDDFLKNAGRNPNKCVSKGATFKCVGYDKALGMVFNDKTKHAYLYNQNDSREFFAEYQCGAFYVAVNSDRSETIKCDEMTLLYEARCYSSFTTVDVFEYDELGILVEKKQIDESSDFCRKKFHHQYGNDSGKPYKSDSENGKQDSGHREGVGDGLGGLLGGGGIATKAKGSIKTPSERDIDVQKGDRSTEDIMKAVRQRTPGLRHIYNKCLKQKPGFSGRVVLKLTIAPDGYVIKMAVASSTTGFPQFDDEIKEAVYRWKFSRDRNVGNTTVTIPFTFSE